MVAGYAAAVLMRGPGDRARLAVATGLVVVFGLGPVVLSSDLFGYLAYARLEVVHGLSPYLNAPGVVPRDPVVPLVFWTRATSPYGPLYTLSSLPAGGISVPAGTWVLKSLSTAGALAGIALLWRAAPVWGRPSGRAVLLVFGNPLLLVYAVGGGHNDLLVLAAVLGALLWLGRDAATGAGLGFAAAIGVKATGGLLLPFALAARAQGRRWLVAGVLGGLAAVAVLTVAVFGVHVLDQLGRIAGSADYVAPWSGPDLIAKLAGGGDPTAAMRVAGGAVAAAAVVGLLGWAIRRPADAWSAATYAALVAAVAVPSFSPWYICWALPAGALARGRGARVAVVVFTALLVATRLPILGGEPA